MIVANRLTGILIAGCGLAAVCPNANGDTCYETATRLQGVVDALPPSDPDRERLAGSLSSARTDTAQCDRITTDVEQELRARSGDGHASGEKPIPNYPNSPAQPRGGPGVQDEGSSASDAEEGHTSGDEPVPNHPTAMPPGSGPSSAGGSGTDEQGTASETEPIPGEESPEQSATDSDDATDD